MAFCVYDNPFTMARENWQNGRVLVSVSSTLIDQKGSNRYPWEDGHVDGDVRAMKPVGSPLPRVG